MEHIGIDLGTGSVKVVVVREDGKTREAGACYPVISKKLGWAETPTGEWIRALAESVSAVGPLDDETTIGFSGQMHGLVPVAAGRALYPAILWSDTRGRDILQRIPSDPDLLSGIMNTPSLGMGLVSILWLKENEPEIYRSTEYFLSPKDFIRYYLTGQALTDPSDAGATLMFDHRRGEWFSDLLDRMGIDSARLPGIVNSFETAAPLTAERVEEFGFPTTAVVRVGGADTACSILGNGIDSADVVQLSIGYRRPDRTVPRRAARFFALDELLPCCGAGVVCDVGPPERRFLSSVAQRNPLFRLE